MPAFAQSLSILTDSSAHLPLLKQAADNAAPLSALQIVPNRLVIGSKTLVEDAALSPEEAFRLMARQPGAAVITPPSVSDYVAAYTRAARDARYILSLHASRELSTSWQNARDAAAQLVGRAHILPLDTRTLGAAQSLLVQIALAARAEQDSFEAVVRQVRRAIDRTYSIYYVENMDTLAQNNLIAPSHAVLGTLLAIKPILTIEHGRLTPMEKVKTRTQAIERLVEFAVEFRQIETLFTLQPRSHAAETTRMLHERLVEALPGVAFSSGMYGASLAALIGTDAIGLALMESERGGSSESEDQSDADGRF